MRRDDLGPRREPSRPVLRWTTPSGRTEEYALSNERPATIGRDANCTIPLDSRMVSKAHALVEFRDGEYTIQDLESANGTRVNGDATSVRVLEPGDQIEIGDIALTFLDLGSADDASGAAGGGAGGSKAVRLALTATITLVVMIGLLYTLIGGSTAPAARPVVEETLAPAPPELVARLRAAAPASAVVKEVVQYASLAGAAPAKALLEEGRLRLESQRWRDAALLLAAAVANGPKDAGAEAAFLDAAAHLDRAASKELAAAEVADYGMRYDDAALHADEVLQLVDRQDPRYDRASKIAEHARSVRAR